MRVKSIILLFLTITSFSFTQSDTTKLDKKSKNRYGVWFIPSSSENIYGIAIGPFGSEIICNRPYTKFSHGINVQLLGQGFLQTFYINSSPFENHLALENSDSLKHQDTVPMRAVHNGLLVSPLGTFTNQINGVSLSLWMSMGEKINGLSFNPLWNLYKQINGVTIGLFNQTAITNGVQIGLINKTIKLKGFQFGLWNKNEKRSLPILNWSFKSKK